MPKHRNTRWPALMAAGSGSGGGSIIDTGETTRNERDPYYLHGADHPGLILVPNPLNGGGNFLPWKSSMLLALSAKNKVQFIDGTIDKPDVNDESFILWKKANSTVTSWILNSLCKELNETFVHFDSAKKLWDAICCRYGENNGPLKHKIKREICNLKQGNNSIVEYFNKLTKLWDELACVAPSLSCDCEIGKIVAQERMDDKVTQFLMGLHDSYDGISNQIMLMDPCPSVDKVFSMLLTAERQRSVNVSYNERTDMAAMLVKTYDKGYGKPGAVSGWNNGKGRGHRMTKEEKAKLHCTNCDGTGHEISTCFRIHGVPDWYKELKERPRTYANAADYGVEAQPKKGESTVDMAAILQQLQEVTRYVREKEKTESHMDFAQFASFAGPSD